MTKGIYNQKESFTRNFPECSVLNFIVTLRQPRLQNGQVADRK